MKFLQHFLIECIGNFFINLHRKFGWGAIILVFLVIEMIIMVYISDGNLFQYMTKKSDYVTVEDARILSSEEIDGEMVYRVKLEIGNYSDKAKGYIGFSAEADTDNYIYIGMTETGYYGWGEERTYGGIPKEEYEDRLEADTGEYVGLLESKRIIPPKTRVTLQYDISMDASHVGDVHEIYIYDSQGQVVSQGYKLILE